MGSIPENTNDAPSRYTTEWDPVEICWKLMEHGEAQETTLAAFFDGDETGSPLATLVCSALNFNMRALFLFAGKGSEESWPPFGASMTGPVIPLPDIASPLPPELPTWATTVAPAPLPAPGLPPGWMRQVPPLPSPPHSHSQEPPDPLWVERLAAGRLAAQDTLPIKLTGDDRVTPRPPDQLAPEARMPREVAERAFPIKEFREEDEGKFVRASCPMIPPPMPQNSGLPVKIETHLSLDGRTIARSMLHALAHKREREPERADLPDLLPEEGEGETDAREGDGPDMIYDDLPF